MLVASILLHSKSKMEFRKKKPNKYNYSLSANYISEYLPCRRTQSSVSSTAWIPHGTTPESISSFMNHTELFLSISSTLEVIAAHQRQSFVEKNKMVKNENDREK